jgi:hypothetical protein
MNFKNINNVWINIWTILYTYNQILL